MRGVGRARPGRWLGYAFLVLGVVKLVSYRF